MIRFKFAMSPLLKTCLASFIALCATLPAQAQQSPLIADDAPRPVTTAYLLVPGEEDSMQLYFGEAALQSDDKVGFEAMWEIAPAADGCTTALAEYEADDLLFSDIVMIGAPDAYASADDIVTRVTGTLLLAAGQHELEIPADLAECQARFMTGYYALREN